MEEDFVIMHTKKELEIIRHFNDSIDREVYDFVKAAIDGEDKLNYITIAFLPKKAELEIERLTGKKVTGSRVVLDINGIKHIEKRHGKEGKQDHSMKNIEDIARMGYVILNFDKIIYEGVTTTGYLDENGEPSPMIKIEKKIDGTYYIVEAVNSSKRKRNYVITAYIKENKTE